MPDDYADPIPRCQPRRRRTNAEKRADDAGLAIPKGEAIRVTDDAVLEWARGLAVCEWCGRDTPTEPSHTSSRGAGGGDTFTNIVALCRPCHDSHHVRHLPNHEQLTTTAARREAVGRAAAASLARRSPPAVAFGTPKPAPAAAGPRHPSGPAGWSRATSPS